MTELEARLVPAGEVTPDVAAQLFALMDACYEGMDAATFAADLAGKDSCILLTDAEGVLRGFSTQRVMTVEVAGRRHVGVFSGDTVIEPAYWGSPALFQCFTRHFIAPQRDEPLWWFLISKGHRTYRMLPVFFERFWPRAGVPTPPLERAVMDAYATALYPDDYNPASGVIEYRTPKDRLCAGVAGIGPRELANPHVAFFVEANPGHASGHDLVCLTELSVANLKPRLRSVLLGRPEAVR